jgi:hypothetical protein
MDFYYLFANILLSLEFEKYKVDTIIFVSIFL